MSVRFQQPLINIRERLNDLFNHRHDNLYEKKGTYIGKNLLSNSNLTISQKGDFSTPFAPVTGVTYVDKTGVLYNSSDVTIEYSHEAFDDNLQSQSLLVTATLSNGSVNSNPALFFSLEDDDTIRGEILTFTVMVKSNTNTVIGLNGGYSASHSGSGEYELLKVTQKIADDALNLILRVHLAPITEGTTAGDYMEVANFKLEKGENFTGLDYIHPAVDLLNVRRFLQPLTTSDAYDVIGTFIAVSTTELNCTLNLSPMTAFHGNHLYFEPGFTFSYDMLGPGSGTISGALTIHSNSAMDLGKLTLKLTGTGFVVGEINVVRKNNIAGIIALGY